MILPELLVETVIQNAPPKLDSDTGGEESVTSIATSNQPTGLIVSRLVEKMASSQAATGGSV